MVSSLHSSGDSLVRNKSLRTLVAFFMLMTCGALAHGSDANYCVISLVPEGDPFEAAVEELREVHNARVLSCEPGDIASLAPKLQSLPPVEVAIVVKPGDFDINLVRSVLRLATEIDEDPFLDFSYGFITGETAKDAVSLVRAGQIDEPIALPESVVVGVSASPNSASHTAKLALRDGQLSRRIHLVGATGDRDGHTAARDLEFIEAIMPTLDQTPLLIFAGHGYPREIVGGPTYEHLSDRRFDHSVVLNIACYAGVSGTWFDTDWATQKTVKKVVPPSQSFCLNMLKTGVAGYVAYACPRPSGPTMLAESITIATSGETLGELRRRRGNNVVMTHLQQGESLFLSTENHDAPVSADRTMQQLLIQMSTGGVLFGDPACRPFQRADGKHPISTKVTVEKDKLRVRVEITSPNWQQFAADQIRIWDGNQTPLRFETDIDLGDRFAADVRIATHTFPYSRHELIAATETHHGKRRLHIKANIANPSAAERMLFARSGIFAEFEVATDSSNVANKLIRHKSPHP